MLTFLAATLGIIAVLMLGLHGGPDVTHRVTLYAFIGYCLLVFAGVLALRVLVLVFTRRSLTGTSSHPATAKRRLTGRDRESEHHAGDRFCL